MVSTWQVLGLEILDSYNMLLYIQLGFNANIRFDKQHKQKNKTFKRPHQPFKCLTQVYTCRDSSGIQARDLPFYCGACGANGAGHLIVLFTWILYNKVNLAVPLL